MLIKKFKTCLQRKKENNKTIKKSVIEIVVINE